MKLRDMPHMSQETFNKNIYFTLVVSLTYDSIESICFSLLYEIPLIYSASSLTKCFRGFTIANLGFAGVKSYRFPLLIHFVELL